MEYSLTTIYHVTFLVAAVSAHYLCSLPSLTYLISIGILLLVAAAAYSCDCDPLDHHSHDSVGTHTIGCLPHIYTAVQCCSGRLFRDKPLGRDPLGRNPV